MNVTALNGYKLYLSGDTINTIENAELTVVLAEMNVKRLLKMCSKDPTYFCTGN